VYLERLFTTENNHFCQDTSYKDSEGRWLTWDGVGLCSKASFGDFRSLNLCRPHFCPRHSPHVPLLTDDFVKELKNATFHPAFSNKSAGGAPALTVDAKDSQTCDKWG